MGNLKRQLKECKHPNSRKTRALSRQITRMHNKHKKRQIQIGKSKNLYERLRYFQKCIKEKTEPLNVDDFFGLCMEYRNQLADESEQITLKNSINKYRSNQNSSRLELVNRKLCGFDGALESTGFEMLNICEKDGFRALKNWDGRESTMKTLNLTNISMEYFKKNSANLKVHNEIADENMDTMGSEEAERENATSASQDQK